MGLIRAGRIFQILLAFYFLEAGAFLVMSPWSRAWSQRVVARSPRSLQKSLESAYFRGFVAGVGLLHVLLGVQELTSWRRNDGNPPELDS